MAKPFEDLTGKKLEDWFQSFIKNDLGFEDYYPSPGQIELSLLDPTQSRGNHLEIDGVLLINKTCLLLEYTSENSGFKSKIKKFNRNSNLLINSSHLSLEEKFKLFNIPANKLEDFKEVENFKYVYFGTNSKIQNEELTRADFPDYPDIQKSLYIIKPNTLEYLRQLSNLIGHHSKNEFLSSMEFTPEEYGESDESIKLDFLKADNKYITGNKVKADVYLLKFTVDQLLRIARVSRYEGIPFILEEENTKHNYQRLLIESKIENISKNFIDDDKRKLFPNTITLVLSNECTEETNGGITKLSIPKKFSSIDIIDGQHRLYGYTKNNISQLTLEKSEILATAIKFKTTKIEDITKNAAKVFVEINSNQARVKNNLIYLIKYDVLGEKDSEALAGKIILLCNNSSESKPLGNVFLTNSLNRKNKFNLPSIPITTIVDNDLIPFIKGLKTNKKSITEKEFENIFGKKRTHFDKHPLELCRKSKSILDQYFNYVRQVFKYDWKKDTSTFLISSKYVSAFIRLLRYYLFDKGISLNDTKKELEALKKKIDKVTKPSNSESFPKGSLKIPSTKHGIKTIFEFLKDVKTFKPKK
ncbi:MAG: DGQHR domain-containing protein [Flavobacteriaceae bacterium]